jgi:GDP-4-dehydro-6-deoxy-D-mannose reductase
MPRILITGVNGFVGTHLARHLHALGADVFGFDLRSRGADPNFFQGELTDHNALAQALQAARPDIIFHLAGVIKSPHAHVLYQANLLATVALLDTVMESQYRPKIIMAGSSAVYGQKAGAKPMSERMRLHPVTHYAVSKAAQEVAALRYHESFRLPVIVLRMFNLLGPGQPPDLACSAFARQIALAEISGESEIVTGNLEARRDFLDVRDAVRAFGLAAQKGKPGQIYNVCSGRAVMIRKCLAEMVALSSRSLTIRLDADRFQKNDVPVQVGTAHKLKTAVGWHPQIPLKQSLIDLLNDWRQRIKLELE